MNLGGDKATDVLFAEAVGEVTREAEDEEAYWNAVHALQQQDPHIVWSLLEPLVDHHDPRVRALIPDVLRFLGGAARPMAEETLALFRRMVVKEPAPEVLAAVGYALGELHLPPRVEIMAPFAASPDPAVRLAVVAALLGARDTHAVEVLIELSRDDDDDVRDWATFGLGTQLGPTDPDAPPEDEAIVDTPALRAALAARLDDRHDDTRCEAIVGLAMRRDPRVLPVLLGEIESGAQFSLLLEAARWLGAGELCAALRRLAASDDEAAVAFWRKNGLTEAIVACCKGGEEG